MTSTQQVIQRLQELLAAAGQDELSDLGPDTPLMTGGLMDSHSTLNLALWIEEQVGSEIDLSEVNFREAWDTPLLIAAFIEKRC